MFAWGQCNYPAENIAICQPPRQVRLYEFYPGASWLALASTAKLLVALRFVLAERFEYWSIGLLPPAKSWRGKLNAGEEMERKKKSALFKSRPINPEPVRGDMTAAEAQRSAELFATEVMPAFA